MQTGPKGLPDGRATTSRIDTCGLACPLPVLKARKALLSLAPGDTLALTATDPLASIDIPHFCEEAGHRLIASGEKDGILSFVIERGADPASGEP